MSNLPPMNNSHGFRNYNGADRSRNDLNSDERVVNHLSGLPGNPVVKNQWFNGQVIGLDGWHFISCRFDNCSLRISTPAFFLENCFIDDTSSVTFTPELIELVRLFNFRNRYMQNGYPQYCPTVNPDGTITVGGK